MRKILVIIFNIAYMVGAALSFWSITTKPIVNARISATFTGEQVAEVVSKAFNTTTETKKTVESIVSVSAPADVGVGKVLTTPEVAVNVSYTDGSTGQEEPTKVDFNSETVATNVEGTVYLGTLTEKFTANVVAEGGAGVEGGSNIKKQDYDIADYFSVNKIKDAFKDGLYVGFTVKVDAYRAYQIHNDKLVEELVIENISTIVDNVVEDLAKPLQKLLKIVATEAAKVILTTAIQEQINTYFSGDNAVIEEEKVEELFDNIYNQISEQEVPIDQLANIIVGRDSEGNQVEGTSVLSILEELSNKANEEGSGVEANGDITYNPENITGDMIATQMVEYLSSVDGLVSEGYYKVNTPTSEELAASFVDESEPNYYKLVGDSYVRITSASEAEGVTDFYVIKKQVNSVDDALAALFNGLADYLENKNNGGTSNSETQQTESNESNEGESENSESRAYLRTRAESVQSSQETEEASKRIAAQIKTYIYNAIKFDQFSAQLSGYNKYIILAFLLLIIAFAAPWGFFFLTTLIRSFRKEKYWANSISILFGTFLTLFFGIILTYGFKYFKPMILGKVPEAYRSYVAALDINIKTGCLIPSFVFCAFVVMLIPYLILSHRAKRQFKIETKRRRYESRYYRRRR